MRRIIVISLFIASAAGLGACTSTSVTSGKASPPTSSASAKASGASATTKPAGAALNPLGTTVTIPNTLSGIDKVTVSAWYPNVTDTSQYPSTPSAGHVWDAIVATTCAGPKGAGTGPDAQDFTVLLSNGSTASTSTGASTAQFGGPLASLSELGGNLSGLTAGQCVRGWVVFSVPTGTAPTAIEFSGTSASFTAPNSVVKWALPTS